MCQDSVGNKNGIAGFAFAEFSFQEELEFDAWKECLEQAPPYRMKMDEVSVDGCRHLACSVSGVFVE